MKKLDVLNAIAKNQNPSFPISNLLDGNPDTFYHSDDKNTENQPWVQLELEQGSVVHNVKITNRDNCCGDRLKNIEVWVGNTNKDWSKNTLCKKFDGPGTNGQVLTLECTKAIPGRYVTMLRNEKEGTVKDWNVMNVAGFEVFGTTGRK